jgi:uroporphyrinogen-III decarboxylase
MFDLVDNCKQLHAFMDRLEEYMLKAIEITLKLEPDEINFCDDWGTQKQLIISPVMWRELFKPRYKRMFDLVHKNKAYVYLHSDGQIMEIVPDLIEIGVDVLNPQCSCMDLEKLARMTRKKMCIAAYIDAQYILPHGSPGEVKQYIKDLISIFQAREGGFWFKPQPDTDVPFSNIKAMFEAFWE